MMIVWPHANSGVSIGHVLWHYITGNAKIFEVNLTGRVTHKQRELK